MPENDELTASDVIIAIAGCFMVIGIGLYTLATALTDWEEENNG